MRTTIYAGDRVRPDDGEMPVGVAQNAGAGDDTVDVVTPEGRRYSNRARRLVVVSRNEAEVIREHLATLPEALAVRQLGERIGFGALMQAAELTWFVVLEEQGLPGGGAHSHYCCRTILVPCPGCAQARKRGDHCDWCCGAGRVTKRVAQAIRHAQSARRRASARGARR